MKFSTRLLLFFIVAVLSLPSYAAKVSGVKVLEYGIFQSRDIKTENTPSIAGGTNYIVNDIKLIKKTNGIPARLNTEFGIRYMILGGTADKKVVVVHKKILPNLRHPQKGVIQKEEFTSLQTPRNETYWGYTFRNDWELTPGDWTFQIFISGKKQAEVTFHIYAPEP